MKALKIINLTLLAFFLAGGSVLAQNPLADPDFGPDSASRRECLNNFVYMHDHAKQKQYDEAMSGWRYCYTNCPKAKKTIYTDGEKILRHKIKNSSGDTKSAYVDTLMMLYDQRIKHFGQKGYVLSKKGTYLAIYSPSDVHKAYKILGKSIDMRGVESSRSTIKNHMNFSAKLGDAGAIDKQQVVEDFTNNTKILKQKLEAEKNEGKKEDIQEAIDAVETMFTNSDAASCDILVEVYKPQFKENPEDMELMVKITSLLEKGKCTDHPFYRQASEQLYDLRPSSGAAYHLAKLFMKDEKIDKAMEYFEEAIDKSKDSVRTSGYYQQLGNIYFSIKDNNRKAVSLGKKAVNYDPNNGSAYILIGRAYADASGSCGENKFHHQSVYWAAVDKFQKAKRVDPSVEDEANKLIDAYSKMFPNNEDAFMFENVTDGERYTIPCWINETTTVRTTQR